MEGHDQAPYARKAFRHNPRVSRDSIINLALALAYARVKCPVFPCGLEKRPLITRGFHAATTDETQIIAWWTHWPNALAAVPTGPATGLWVLDVDGPTGRESLRQLLAHLGLESVADLTPVISRTPSGGLQLFFRWQPGETPRNRARDIGPGLDTRGVTAEAKPAGYFIAPGNVLPDGRSYEFVDPAALADGIARMILIFDAPPAPRGLLFVATFSSQGHRRIGATPR
jgi:Bifunctional DNA primase/polymerase, N-terminal